MKVSVDVEPIFSAPRPMADSGDDHGMMDLDGSYGMDDDDMSDMDGSMMDDDDDSTQSLFSNHRFYSGYNNYHSGLRNYLARFRNHFENSGYYH